ncbi:hypothetical protein HDE74_000505 [Janthinobacterium sp. K2Li3]|nr:hypothetical protein [Janthinobacterium sp. K2C7]MBB5379819.1 hypothetical protein [Janthinobacterium sp. K2Li3]MBB5386085.1 hypothetical protein [Janthinobacterium sp. K2E3]
MSHYKPYSSYKDSGVEWLGQVPAHWEVRRLKYSVNHITEKTDRRESVIALENIESWAGRFVETSSEFEGEGIGFNHEHLKSRAWYFASTRR